MNGAKQNYAKWNKPNTEQQMFLCSFLYVELERNSSQWSRQFTRGHKSVENG